jgi:ribosomal protein S18 acetylase RimI-like enzyme
VSRTQVSPAAIRRADPGDLAALRDFFAGLSVRTRFRRFFAAITPSQAMLRFLSGGTGTADAVVASCGDVIIGHAMAVDQAGPGGTRLADIGVVVADAWQGRGVGAALTRALIAAAQARGVTTLTMDVQPGNREVLAMVAQHWPAAHTSRGADGATIHVPLPRPGHQWPDSRPPVTADENQRPLVTATGPSTSQPITTRENQNPLITTTGPSTNQPVTTRENQRPRVTAALADTRPLVTASP